MDQSVNNQGFDKMKKHFKVCLPLLTVLLGTITAWSQGPPILTDKPIMLGEKKGAIRSYFLYRQNNHFSSRSVPVMFDYNLRNDLELSAALPLVFANELINKNGIGDATVGVKYQFIRVDKIGKTFRVAAKAKQVIPTGAETIAPELGMQEWQTMLGIVGGIESIKYGIQGEVGYMLSADQESHMNKMLTYKLGFGLPLLKPVYPVKQVTLYFEYEGITISRYDHFAVFYAQGLQYAWNRWTFDVSAQWPLKQDLPIGLQRNFSVLTGARFIL